MNSTFTMFDYSILVVYVLASVSVGLWFARSQKSVEGYYLAERSAPWWAVAISIISSDTTAISYMGCASLVFTAICNCLRGRSPFPSPLCLFAWYSCPFWPV